MPDGGKPSLLIWVSLCQSDRQETHCGRDEREPGMRLSRFVCRIYSNYLPHDDDDGDGR